MSGRPASAPARTPLALPANVHATAIVIGETGVLVRGASGAGKSMLALGLMAAARQVGLCARLIGDDRVLLSERGGRLIAAGHPRIAGKIERRGEGAIEAPHETRALLHCVIDMAEAGRDCGDLPRWPPAEAPTIAFGSVHLPVSRLPAGPPGPAELLRALDFARRHGAPAVK